MKFCELMISENLKKAIIDMQLETLTDIQNSVIPNAIDKNDVIAKAPTGSGKTLAFALPICQNIVPEDKHLQALILCPTRELASQVGDEFKKLLKYTENVKVVTIYGGQNFDRQLANLRKKPQIIVGTTGRVLDHLDRKTIKPHNLASVVLDEADEMLDMGFKPDIDKIFKKLPKYKQVLLFSATIDKEILNISREYQVNPIEIVSKNTELPKVEQIAIKCKELDKIGLLTDLIDINEYKTNIVFCNTKKRVNELVNILNNLGYNANGLHSDIRQKERDNIMKKFKIGELDILVATDVVARGIDVNNVGAVFNFDVPNDKEYYVHRIGRTARANKNGVSYTFYTKGQTDLIEEFERFTKINMIKKDKMQEFKDIKNKKMDNLFKGLDKNLDNTISFIEKSLIEYNKNNNTNYTALDLLAVALDGNANMIMSANESRSVKQVKENLKKVDSTRYFINLGEIDKMDNKKLIDLISNNTNIPKSAILDTKVLEKYSFIQLMSEYNDNIFSINGTKLKNRTIVLEKAEDSKKTKQNKINENKVRSKKQSKNIKNNKK